MLNANNPFVFASSSAANPLTAADPVASAPGLVDSFNWTHLLVTLALESPALPPSAPEPEAATTFAPAHTEAVPVAAEPVAAPVVAAPVVAAPAPALVTIAEPAPRPAPAEHFVPGAMPQDPAFDAYARLFQGIEDRDLLADLHATLAPGSDWANAFGPPLG